MILWSGNTSQRTSPKQMIFFTLIALTVYIDSLRSKNEFKPLERIKDLFTYSRLYLISDHTRQSHGEFLFRLCFLFSTYAWAV